MTKQTIVILNALFICAVAAVAVVFGERDLAAEKEARDQARAAEEAAAKLAHYEVPVTPDRIAKGKELYTSQGCVACHSIDGSTRVGPSLAELYGRKEKLTDGSVVKVDDAYLRESLLDPTARVVAGYVPTMPPYSSRLSDADVEAVVAFVKSIN